MDIKKILTIIFVLLLIFGISIRVLSLNKDFISEETEFVKPALAISQTGRPLFYHSEQQPLEMALCHPPMYIFLMGVIFKISVSEISARLINFTFSIFTSWIIFLFCLKLIENKMGKIIGLISASLFLINFYVFSSSVQIDIDILSTFFVFSFLFFVLMNYKTGKNYFLILAGLCFFGGLANRYPIMIISYIFVGGYYFLNKELKKDFRKYLLTGAVSGGLFVIIWGIYSIIIEPGNFFSFIVHNFKFGGEQLSDLTIYIGSFLLNITQLIRLVTFPIIILMVWSWFYFFKTKSKLIKILLLYVIPVFLFFFLIPRPAFGYPRYFTSIFPGVFILIGIFLYINLRYIKINNFKIFVVLAGFIISLFLLIVLKPEPAIYAANGLIKATNLPDFIFHILASLPVFFVFLFKKEKRKMLIILLLAVSLSYSLYFDYQLVNYEPHIKETAEYIKENTLENETVIVPKSIGHYTERKFYVNNNNKPKLDFSLAYLKEYIKKSWENPKMDDEFFWPEGFYGGTSYYDINPGDELKKASYVVLYHPVNNFPPEKIISEFYIYRRLT